MGTTTAKYWINATWTGSDWLIEIPAIKAHPVVSTMRYRDIEREARPLVEEHSARGGSLTQPLIEIRAMLPSTGSRNLRPWARSIAVNRSAERIGGGKASPTTRHEERVFVETLHRRGVPVIDMADLLSSDVDQVRRIVERISGKSESYRANAVREGNKGWRVQIVGVEHEPVYAPVYGDIREAAADVIRQDKDVFPELSFTVDVGDVTLPDVPGITSVIKRGEFLAKRLKEAGITRAKDHANQEAAEFAVQLTDAGVPRWECAMLLDVWDAGFTRLLNLGRASKRLRDSPVPMRSDGVHGDVYWNHWNQVSPRLSRALRDISGIQPSDEILMPEKVQKAFAERDQAVRVAVAMPSGSSDFTVKPKPERNPFGFPTGVAIGHVYRNRSIDWLWTGAQWFPLPDEN
ncbi:hypothetical protein E3_0270 [Rhodococcus phage E3]|uniref:hypothetical protein n=1 Tax=Rhodococcus phage E3 TaxID=1007869 RepID=UPI0002C6AB54|nr:hypothetical protein M176_gp028 [Rhodococcus phage E3]AEQ20938.1 hypothetical protein E3_0270 [Rhodococcus phage E3]